MTGVGPNGGTLLVGHGPDAGQHRGQRRARTTGPWRVVTRGNDAERTDLASLKPGEPKTVSGPLEWAAIKSKYFVTGLLAYDSTGGRISGATITAAPDRRQAAHRGRRPARACRFRPSGEFSYTAYAGPMEYDRLGRLGHGFDDVNPYGWPGFRTIIRPVAVGVRWLLVWMHEHLHLAYGLVLVFFGILVRVLLWPLNQKAMRANMQLQAVQPLMKDIQERYKNDPQKMQQEMFKLYKEYGVNPLGGCWPMLLPMPVLFALFFVFQNTIELAGRLVPVAAGPVAARSALHHPGDHGALDVRAQQGGPDRDGAQPADEDDAVRHAGHDDVPVPQLRLGAQPVLRGEQHREHPPAVDAGAGAAASGRGAKARSSEVKTEGARPQSARPAA